jgi:hypothetical protein
VSTKALEKQSDAVWVLGSRAEQRNGEAGAFRGRVAGVWRCGDVELWSGGWRRSGVEWREGKGGRRVLAEKKRKKDK